MKEHSDSTELVDCFVTWSYIVKKAPKKSETASKPK